MLSVHAVNWQSSPSRNATASSTTRCCAAFSNSAPRLSMWRTCCTPSQAESSGLPACRSTSAISRPRARNASACARDTTSSISKYPLASRACSAPCHTRRLTRKSNSSSSYVGAEIPAVKRTIRAAPGGASNAPQMKVAVLLRHRIAQQRTASRDTRDRRTHRRDLARWTRQSATPAPTAAPTAPPTTQQKAPDDVIAHQRADGPALDHAHAQLQGRVPHRMSASDSTSPCANPAGTCEPPTWSRPYRPPLSEKVVVARLPRGTQNVASPARPS